MISKDLEESVQEVCRQSVLILRTEGPGERRKGAEWLLTVGVRYLNTQGVRVNPAVYEMYRQIGMDEVELVLPRRKGYF